VKQDNDYSDRVGKPDEQVPVAMRSSMDMSPARVGRRMIWQFKFEDGSSLATYNSRKGFRLANLMMKAGRL
jgi:hypothetical protein